MLSNRRALILKRKEEQKLKEIQMQSSHKMEDTEMKDETCNPQKEECMKDLNVEDPNQSTSAPEILPANNQQIKAQVNQRQKLCYKSGQNIARYRGQSYNDQGYVSEEYGAESDEEEELDDYDEGSYGIQRPSKKRENIRRQRLLQEDDDQQSEDVRMRGESEDEYDQEDDPYGEEYDSNEDEEDDNVGEEPSIEMVEAEAKQWVQRGEWDIGKKQFHTAVDHNKPYILYLDSMNVATESLMLPLRTYIEMEYLEKKLPQDQKKYFTEECYWRGFSQWTMPTYQPAVPKQNNSFDCGLFLLEYAEIFAENPIFILDNLRQEGVELFKEEWIDMKRDIVKRLIIALQTPMPVQEIGINYSNWRQKQQLKYTHQICPKNKPSGLTPIKLLGDLMNKDQAEFPTETPTNLISPNV
ncbi:hypothetical protein FGO68_gene5133 [Halteria grandinella]|uniref:Ubiquitin-like protease family profile domain-containing protein n=1 Tax=Halteria grandinella TaxID=5974 RepID=A0A8J8P4P2_HALGN|nr:hypothetical protein FGO68_gene5133 [Halteria grandinella]